MDHPGGIGSCRGMAIVTVENVGCNKDDLLEKESGSEFAKRFWKMARPS